MPLSSRRTLARAALTRSRTPRRSWWEKQQPAEGEDKPKGMFGRLFGRKKKEKKEKKAGKKQVVVVQKSDQKYAVGGGEGAWEGVLEKQLFP